MSVQDVLQPEDFIFDGPLGSKDAVVRKIAPGHFAVELQAAAAHRPRESNLCQFEIKRNARGVALRLDVTFNGGCDYPFNTYFVSWSHDARDWKPLAWQQGYMANSRNRDDGVDDTLVFPVFEHDRVFVANQAPMSYEDTVELLHRWVESSDRANLFALGETLEGRPVYRLEISSSQSSVPYGKRSGHYFANQHPAESNAMWRMAGMVEWLLTPEAERFLEANVCYFIFMMSPDSPRRGYMRVNTKGEDLNRGYRKLGASRSEQPYECYMCQSDFEKLTRRLKITDTWAMHTWAGIVEPIAVQLGPSTPECLAMDRELRKADPEGVGHVLPVFDSNDDLTEHTWGLGPIQQFGICLHDRVIKLPAVTGLKRTIMEADHRKLIKPLSVYQLLPSDKGRSWGTGPLMQFGIPTFLCEGGGSLNTIECNMDSGRALIEGLAKYSLMEY